MSFISTPYTLISDLAALKAVAGRPRIVLLLGYWSENDGGGGPPFKWVPGSTAVADDFMVVNPTSSGVAGRYIRQVHSGANVSPLWGGCGLGVLADDTAQFLKVLKYGAAVDASGGVYKLDQLAFDTSTTGPGIFSDGSAIFQCPTPASNPITSGTYNNSTGEIILTVTGTITIAANSGSYVQLSGLTGTGAFALLMGQLHNVTSIVGQDIHMSGSAGLGTSAITGGTVTHAPNYMFFSSNPNKFYFRRLNFIMPVSTDPNTTPACGRAIWWGAPAGTYGENWEVSDCNFSGGQNGVVVSGGSRNFKYMRNWNYQVWGDSLSSNHHDGAIIDDNSFDGCGIAVEAWAGAGNIRIGFGGTFGSALPGALVSISRNKFRNCYTLSGQSIIDCFSSILTALEINNNIVVNCGGTIELKTTDAANSTSTSSVAIGTGSKSFTTQAGVGYTAGMAIRVSSYANTTVDYMIGTVTSYSGTALVVNVTSSGGSGTHTDWTMLAPALLASPDLYAGFSVNNNLFWERGAISIFYAAPNPTSRKAGNMKLGGNSFFRSVRPLRGAVPAEIRVSAYDKVAVMDTYISNGGGGLFIDGQATSPSLDWGSFDLTVSGNIIDCVDVAFSLGNGTVTRLNLLNNFFKGGLDAVRMQSPICKQMIATGNTFLSPVGNGLAARDLRACLFEGNRIFGGSQAMGLDTANPTDNVFRRNTFKSYVDPNETPAASVTATAAGSGLTDGTRIFTVTDANTGEATIFSFLVSGGAITGAGTILQPGKYSSFPTTPTVTVDTGIVDSAAFSLVAVVAGDAIRTNGTNNQFESNSFDVPVTKAAFNFFSSGFSSANSVRGFAATDPNGTYLGSVGDVLYCSAFATLGIEKWVCVAFGGHTFDTYWRAFTGQGMASRAITAAGALAMHLGDSEVVLMKTTPAATAVTLPPLAPFGQLARVSDGLGDASTHNITVGAASGGTINGVVGNLTMNVNWGTTLFRSLGSNAWQIL